MRLAVVLLSVAVACSGEKPGTGTGAGTARAMVRRVEVVSWEVVEVGGKAAVEVTARGGWPGRAQDPVLRVGGREFREYEFSGPETIRFVVGDRAAVEQGTMAVQYGDDAASRVVVRR